jgi:DNA-binding XRE family transcriptional regulator
MLELTKKPHTEGYVRVSAIVPADRVLAVEQAIQEATEPNVPLSEAFPNSTPGSVLRGARGLRELTQAQLAATIGVHKTHISEMERGKRGIGKAMAKRLGQALEFPYRAFL